jgi:excisionase family DNA binding protein
VTHVADTIHEHPLRTVAECAAILRCSEMSVYRWIRRGHLPAFRAPSGHLIRVRDRDLLAFIERGARR